MRLAWLILPLASCLTLQCSTDTFTGGDGAVDASSEGAPLDAGGSVDGMAGDGAGVPDATTYCAFDGGVACGVSKDCGAFSQCCVTTTAAVCAASSGVACAGASFQCMSQSDCGDAGAVCCISAIGGNCPHDLTGSGSRCVAPNTCDSPGHRACTSDAECLGSSVCQTATFGGLTMGACVGG